MKLVFQQTQRPLLTPSMHQSITVLILPLAELNLAIEQELQNNPLLEIDEQKSLSDQEDANLLQDLQFYKNLTDPHYRNQPDDEHFEEKPITKELTLEDSLLQQLRCEFSDPLELKIGELIIGNIDEDGYLKSPCEEIAAAAGLEDTGLIEKILKVIQNFEPLGIASRNLEECLSIQIKAKYNGPSEMACKIVNEHLNDLSLKRYLKIARRLKVQEEDIKKLAGMISSLDPKPARNYRPLSPNTYIKPDVVIRKNDDQEYQIQINREGTPHLRINPVYKNLIHQPNLSEEEKNFIREKLKNALMFLKSIEQRGHTIQLITKYILEHQKDFWEGAQFSINPMTLKDVAQAINRNESTVCRAINNKYVETPQGIFPIKFFFSQAVANDHNDPVSTRGVKEEIKELIQNENKSAPLSDQAIQKYFEKKGLHLARRTISKYRLVLKILPSHLRKEI